MKAHLESRGRNLRAQKRLFYIAIETYQANEAGSKRTSFRVGNRALEGSGCLPCIGPAWEAFPTRELSFPKDSQARQGSGRERPCLHQEMEKLKANQIGYITPSKGINAEHRKNQRQILASTDSLLHHLTRRWPWQHGSTDSHQLTNRTEETSQEK